jgi:hypothetical protein
MCAVERYSEDKGLGDSLECLIFCRNYPTGNKIDASILNVKGIMN